MTTERAKVVHVRDTVPDAVYIGRAMPRQGLQGSPVANPYRIGRHGDRATVITQYRAHVLASPKLLRLLPALRGRPLACWCRHDGETEPACHGDVLIAMLDRYTDDELRVMADD